MKILLVGNHSVLNAGDYAILLQTLAVLQHTFPQANIGLMFNDPESARALFPNTLIYPSPLAWTTYKHADGQVGQQRRIVRWFYVVALLLSACIYRFTKRTPRIFIHVPKHELVEAYAQADLVLACGGGYLYGPSSQNGRAGWFTFIALPCVLAIVFGKPLILLPQSIGPLHDQDQRRIVRWIVRWAAMTCVREARSWELLHHMGGAQRALIMPDLAFGFASAPAAQARAVLERVTPQGLQPSFRVGITALNWHGQNASFGGQSTYEQALIGCIDHITAQGGSVVLFAQTCGPSEGEDDRRVNLRLHQQVREPERVMVLNDVLEPALLQAAYGQMDFFIGTRMHSVILALNTETPALAIGYLHKTQGVLSEIGIAEHCYDISTLTAEQLIAGFEKLRAAPPHEAIASYLAHAQRVLAGFSAVLRSLTHS